MMQKQTPYQINVSSKTYSDDELVGITLNNVSELEKNLGKHYPNPIFPSTTKKNGQSQSDAVEIRSETFPKETINSGLRIRRMERDPMHLIRVSKH